MECNGSSPKGNGMSRNGTGIEEMRDLEKESACNNNGDLGISGVNWRY